MNRKLYVWGWWQGNNLGDNWIKKTLGHHFPNAIFVDTSVQQFEKNSFVICGGGGLFIYDVISPWNHIQKNIQFGILGLGAEFPHETMTAVELYKQSKFFYVRDEYSKQCMHLPNIDRSYDLTFSLPLKWSEVGETNRDKIFFVWRDGHELLANSKFREYIKAGEDENLKISWRSLIKKHFAIIAEDDFQTRDDDIEERISNCGFVISGRYHGVVAAIQRGLPFIAIDICPKIRALLQECGLEEYCIKISETDKIEPLIIKAQSETEQIRQKEQEFIKRAYTTLQKQIEYSKVEILKAQNPLRIIHYGSYWMKKNDVIYTMADDLSDLCKLKIIDLRLYTNHPSKRIASNYDTPNGKQCVLDRKRILRDIKKYKADAIILNSGGLYLDDKTVDEVKKLGVTTVGISLSDPDVFPYNGKIYSNKFDIFYTNSKYSLNNEYPSTGANVRIMPFAASKKHHYYMPEIARKYDLVIVAHAREDRFPIVERLEKICNVGTYGSGWKNSLGTVNGLEHVKAINSGKMYLSFSRTMAGYENVKVGLFEAMACNQVVITSYMEELQDYFDIGEEILCYRTEDELYDLVKYYLAHDQEREAIRKKGYMRFLNEHTYTKRWNDAIACIYKEKMLL